MVLVPPPFNNRRRWILTLCPNGFEPFSTKHGIEGDPDGGVVGHLRQWKRQGEQSGATNILHGGDLVRPVAEMVQVAAFQHENLFVFFPNAILLKDLPAPLSKLVLSTQLRGRLSRVDDQLHGQDAGLRQLQTLLSSLICRQGLLS